MTDKQTLKPCPFCGGRAIYTLNAFHGDQSIATCQQCGASAYWRKWNTRIAALSKRTGMVELIEITKSIAFLEAHARNCELENCDKLAVRFRQAADALSSLQAEKAQIVDLRKIAFTLGALGEGKAL